MLVFRRGAVIRLLKGTRGREAGASMSELTILALVMGLGLIGAATAWLGGCVRVG